VCNAEILTAIPIRTEDTVVEEKGTGSTRTIRGTVAFFSLFELMYEDKNFNSASSMRPLASKRINLSLENADL
jgi:hypothetical protein